MKMKNKIKKTLNNKWLRGSSFIALGLLVGWFIKPSNNQPIESSHNHTTESLNHQLFTCAMHPQIRADEPGNCPICGMELIPVTDDSETGEDTTDYTVKLSDAAMKIAEVSTSKVEFKTPFKVIYLPGMVMPDERNIAELTARYPGRIEHLFVNITGQLVKKGQVLAKVYSPELVTAQRELFEAYKLKDSNPNYYKAARNKLKLWDLSEEQVDNIIATGNVKFSFDVLSPLTGTITKRHVALGDYLDEGDELFEVVNLSKVWAMFDAYESDLPWIKNGDIVRFSIKSIPDRNFEGHVTFIDPVLDMSSRVAQIRVELKNQGGLLKPGMMASGEIIAMRSATRKELLIPKSAVLWTGKKSVVYVRAGSHENLFSYREIELGADGGDFYTVRSGLSAGEYVASNGVFKIDAAAQLKGEKSMMNPSGGKVSTGMAGMDMGGGMKMNKQGPKTSNNDTSLSTGKLSEFQDHLNVLFGKYLSLKDMLVESNPVGAGKAASDIANLLTSTSAGQWLEHDLKWTNIYKDIDTSIRKIMNTRNLDLQRIQFSIVSNSLYEALKHYEIHHVNAYYQYCPMVNGNTGAFWLSNSDEIRNPYFGEVMLTCGETKEIIK